MVNCCTIFVGLLAVLLAFPLLLRGQPELEPDLKGQVCLVTGASRGIGKGIAIALGEQGCTVYITGRKAGNQDGGPDGKPQEGTLDATCALVESVGGKCVPCVVDSSDDGQLEALFDRIEKEQGRLDVLVNNAFAGVRYLPKVMGKPFWDLSPESWDWINNVGLRSHYVASIFGSRLMSKKKKGLIINVSSFGGLDYIFNVAYGIGKAAMDRMANDMAVELATENVTMISLWPGLVKTENVGGGDALAPSRMGPHRGTRPGTPEMQTQELMPTALSETPLFSGRAIAFLARDKNKLDYSGKILITSNLASWYGFTDERGVRSPSLISLKSMLSSLVLRPALEWLGCWEVPEGDYTGSQPVLPLVAHFYWNLMPDLNFPPLVLKLLSGCANF